MKTAVIGVGHVGLVTAGCLARWGHEVVGMDLDQKKIDTLLSGDLPFYEPGLLELVQEGVESGRITFTTDMAEAIKGTEVAFVCVGTPELPGGAPNLAYVEAVGRDVAAVAANDIVLVEKSTVPANTGVRLTQVITREQKRAGNGSTISVASNPEFLKEGTAVEDTLYPDRVVIGGPNRQVTGKVRECYEPMLQDHGCEVVETDLQTAELIKHASNAFLATKISFINAVARVCDLVGADVKQVAAGMGLDQRIGNKFLHAGLGYGGSCFPKDVNAFIHLAGSVGYDFRLLREVRQINEDMRNYVMEMLRQELWHLEGKTITLLGGAFKPGTDDLREAPGMYIAKELIEMGATVRIYDPVAAPQIIRALPEAEVYTEPLPALRDAHAAVVCTEWDEVKKLTPQQIADELGYPILIDGRNVFEPSEAIEAGLHYHSIGRPLPASAKQQ